MRRPMLVLFGLMAAAAAQDPPGGIDTLNAILMTPVVSANLQPTPIRESPGIITVLTRTEIQASGARDLIDLLKMVPGLGFGSDTQGVVGLGVRGNWGHDGKVLLLMDGLEMTEPLYGTNQWGGHYPLGNIQRVEVIRGPGSSIYGQFAELAVINIITRSARDAEGLSGEVWLGRMDQASQQTRSGQINYGASGALGSFTVSYARGDAPEGTGPFQTPSGAVQAGALSGFHQDFLNLGASLAGLNLRYIRDGYSIDDFTRESGTAVPPSRPLTFSGQYFSLDYVWRRGDWEVKPSFSLKDQLPWTYNTGHTDKDTRGVARLLATYKATGELSFLVGAEATQDDANIYWNSRQVRQVYVYENRAVLAQMLWSTALGNLDLGVRSDHNSEFGSVLSPRVAFTRATPDWHFKILLAGAFRAPSIEDLFVNPALEPERTHSYEAEAGWALSPHFYLTANLFSEAITDPIAYSNPSPGVNTYLNFDRVGSRGAEVVLKGQFTDLSLQGSVTFQDAQDRNAQFFRVPDDPGSHIGFPKASATLQAQWRFLPGWSFNPGLLYLGSRNYYPYGATTLSRQAATTTLDVFLTWELSRHFQAGLRVANATNATVPYLQPYGFAGVGGNPPLPGPGREEDLRLTFQF